MTSLSFLYKNVANFRAAAKLILNWIAHKKDSRIEFDGKIQLLGIGSVNIYLCVT